MHLRNRAAGIYLFCLCLFCTLFWAPSAFACTFLPFHFYHNLVVDTVPFFQVWVTWWVRSYRRPGLKPGYKWWNLRDRWSGIFCQTCHILHTFRGLVEFLQWNASPIFASAFLFYLSGLWNQCQSVLGLNLKSSLSLSYNISRLLEVIEYQEWAKRRDIFHTESVPQDLMDFCIFLNLIMIYDSLGKVE